MVNPSDQLSLLMYKAWNNGISTHEFRKCLRKDLQFIQDMDSAILSKQKKQAQEQKVQDAMEKLGQRGF